MRKLALPSVPVLLAVLVMIVPEPAVAQDAKAGESIPPFSYRPESPRERLALAIHRAREGRIDAALGALDGNEDPRLAREAERLQVLRDYRRSLLESKVGKAIRLTEGADICRIQSLEGDEVALSSKSRDWTLPITAIGPENLISIQGRRDVEDAPGWVAAYTRLLAGQEDHERYLGDDDGSEALRSDAADYAELRDVGHAAFLLSSLGEEGAAPLRLLEGLAGYRDLPIVRSRLDEVRALARSIVAASFDPSSLDALGLAARIETSEEGTPVLVYDFDDPGQAADFVEMPGYLQFNRGRLRGKAPEIPTLFEVHDRALEVRGASCYRHVLAFQAPMTVRYRLQFNAAPQDPNPVFMLGICADEKESHVGFENVNRLYSLNRENGVRRTRLFQQAKLLANQTYTIELSHDGQGKARVKLDTDWREVEGGARTDGHVILWFHNMNGVLIDRLEIEGAPILGEAARRQWVDAKLGELGFETQSADQR